MGRFFFFCVIKQRRGGGGPWRCQACGPSSPRVASVAATRAADTDTLVSRQPDSIAMYYKETSGCCTFYITIITETLSRQWVLWVETPWLMWREGDAFRLRVQLSPHTVTHCTAAPRPRSTEMACSPCSGHVPSHVVLLLPSLWLVRGSPLLWFA